MQDEKPRILVIEDEVDIATAVAERLESHGYAVAVAHDGLTGLERARRWKPDLVVLDLMLPRLSGHEVCRELQSDGHHLPVIMLTALDDETDMLVGLRMGADDYLTKPFSPRVLVARVEALLRRSRITEASVNVPGSHDVVGASWTELGEIALDVPGRRVMRAGVEVHLTPTEFNLFQTLVDAGGTVLTRAELLHRAWGYDDDAGARTVDSHIRSVRRKLGDWTVRTVHGVGYSCGVPE